MSRSLLRFTLLIAVLCVSITVCPQIPTPSKGKEPRVKELAEALIAAKTKTERSTLLEKGRELKTPLLVQELKKLGIKFFSRGEYPEALDVFTFTLDVARQLGDRLGTAQILDNIGSVHFSKDRHRLALDYYSSSLSLSKQIKNKPGIAGTLNNIANVLHELGDYVGALKNYNDSFSLLEELKQTATATKVLNNIGIVYHDQGEYVLALKYYRMSLARKQAVAETAQDKDSIAKTLNNIGNLFNDQGDYIKALEALEKSESLYESLPEGKEAGLAVVFGNKGVVYQDLGNHGLALNIFRESLKYYEQAEDLEGVAGTLNNIGNALKNLGDYKGAEDQYRKSIAQHKDLEIKAGEVGARYNLAGVLYLQKKYEDALENYRLSLSGYRALNEKAGMADTLANIAEVHNAMKNYRQALRLTRESIALARSIESPLTLWSALTNQSVAYRALNQPLLARKALIEAIEVIETLRTRVVDREQDRQAFFESKIAPYHELVDLLVDQKKIADALKYSERAKGRVVLEVMQRGKINVSKSMSADEQQHERNLLNQLTSLNAQVLFEKRRQPPDARRLADLVARRQNARQSYEAFQTSMYALHGDLRRQRGTTPAVNVTQLQQLVSDSNRALLEYAVTEKDTYLFVITRDNKDSSGLSLKVYPLGITRDTLRKNVERFLDQLTNRNPEFSESAEALYRLLMWKAREQLGDKKTLTIVPDDVLWQLPFETLRPTGDGYLVESFAVRYVPSLTILWEMSFARRPVKTTSTPKLLLAVGNPSLAGESTERAASLREGDDDLGPIPYAEEEVRILESLYGKGQSRLFIGQEAREDKVKNEIAHYRLLHFATHSILNNSSPMYSNIVLTSPSNGTTEDGLLEAWEIVNMNLAAEMAVLSGCETGRGRSAAGEGIIGLTWAFSVAGCPTTVVSQWKVADISTPDFMERFYGNLRKGMIKSEALREAKMWMIKYSYHTDEMGRVTRHSHPFYWAPFILIGKE